MLCDPLGRISTVEEGSRGSHSKEFGSGKVISGKRISFYALTGATTRNVVVTVNGVASNGVNFTVN